MRAFLAAFYLLACLILLSLFSCAGDEADPSEDLIGTWELVSIDGKTPKAAFQEDWGDKETEVIAAAMKLVFVSDGSLFLEVSATQLENMADLLSPIFLKMAFRFTMEGRYVLSGSTIEFIFSFDHLNIDIEDISVETPGHPELQQRLEQELDFQEVIQELEAEGKSEIAEESALVLETSTFDLEADILTLSNGSESVYRKR